MGLHIVGPWPAAWRQSRGASAPHMLFKELVAPAVATMLLAPFRRGTVACAALDNAGTAFTVNSLSSNCCWTTELLRAVADCCYKNRLGLLGGHAHRTHNDHCDKLSHALPPSLWRQALATAPVARHHRIEFHFAIADVVTGECFLATISVRKPR